MHGLGSQRWYLVSMHMPCNSRFSLQVRANHSGLTGQLHPMAVNGLQNPSPHDVASCPLTENLVSIS